MPKETSYEKVLRQYAMKEGITKIVQGSEVTAKWRDFFISHS
jgi:hypothetical protein